MFSSLDLATINIYSQVGLITLVGLIAKNGILIGEFANTLQARGLSKTAALRRSGHDAIAAGVDDFGGDGVRPSAAGPGVGARRAAARNSIGMVLVTGMTVGTCSRCLWCRCSIIDRDAASAGGGTGPGRGPGLQLASAKG